MTLILLLAVSAASASWTPSLSVGGSGVACFPTQDYLKQSSASSFRPSLALEGDLSLLSFDFGSFGFSFCMSWISVTRSTVSGNSVLRPYSGIGASLKADFDFSERFGLEAGARYLWCSFKPMEDRFRVLDLFAGPTVGWNLSSWFRLGLSSPITVSIKSDAVSLRVGVACSMEFIV